MGFRLVGRHRSREVLRYAQSGMNVIINAHGLPPGSDETPQLSALALRVRDAAAAWRRVVDLGAWPVPVDVQPMELHIPAIHGVGASRIYFVDRWQEFSIFDVDFVPLPTVAPQVPATAGLHWFGLVQYIDADRTADWTAFYAELLGCRALPKGTRHGILPAGRVLASPCGSFHLQLIEPGEDGRPARTTAGRGEQLQRLAFGAPDVPAAVQALQQRGVGFVDAAALRPDARGALTEPLLPGTMFELVHHLNGRAAP